MSLFGSPVEEGYDVLLAENGFIHDIQIAIEVAMESAGMSRADLAAALNVSQARVSQMLADNGKNLRARTIAKVAHALGRRAFLDFVDDCASWTTTEVSEEDVVDQSAFTDWVNRACSVLESNPSVRNDNDWMRPSDDSAAGKLVAA